MLDAVLRDDASDRHQERCRLYGLPSTSSTAEIAEKLRPIMPHCFRTLSLEEGHFFPEVYDQKRLNNMLSCMIVSSNSNAAIMSDNLWGYDSQSHPLLRKYVYPVGLRKM